MTVFLQIARVVVDDADRPINLRSQNFRNLGLRRFTMQAGRDANGNFVAGDAGALETVQQGWQHTPVRCRAGDVAHADRGASLILSKLKKRWTCDG